MVFPWFSIQSYSVLNDTTAEAQHLGQKFFDLAIPRAVAVQLVPGRIANQHDPTLGANFHIEVSPCTEMYSSTLIYIIYTYIHLKIKIMFISFSLPQSSKQSHRNWRAEPSAIRRSAKANSRRFVEESVPPGTS